MILAPILAIALAATPPASSLAELRDAVRRAEPGDRVVLRSGTYEGSVYLEHIHGEEGRPITISGEDPDDPPVIRGRAEGLHLSASSWVTIENLAIERASANGINIDDAGRTDEPSVGITLRRLHVRDIGPVGNRDAIKLSGLARFTVEDCTIERWGDAGSGIDMVGCSQGVIRRCVLRHADTKGSNGIQAKGGSREIRILDCRFDHAGRRAINLGGSTGLAFFRPAPRGYEAADLSVEDCTIIGSEASIAFVGVDGAAVRFCTLYRPAKWALRILQETREPGFVPSRNGVFEDNIIVFDRPAQGLLNIGDATAPETFRFARNVWFNSRSPDRSTPLLPVDEHNPIHALDPRFRDPVAGDFTPDPLGPAARAGAHAPR